MPVINWSFLCDYAFVDEKGRASIIRTFSSIRAGKLPFMYPQMFLALEVLSVPGESFSLGAQVSAPSGKTAAKVTIHHKGRAAAGAPSDRVILPIGFSNLRFEEAGEYHVEILVNELSVHFMPLIIEVPPAATGQRPARA